MQTALASARCGAVQAADEHVQSCCMAVLACLTQNCRINRPYRDAQDRLLWRDKTCPART